MLTETNLNTFLLLLFVSVCVLHTFYKFLETCQTLLTFAKNVALVFFVSISLIFLLYFLHEFSDPQLVRNHVLKIPQYL